MYTTTYSKITQIHSNITETHFVCTGTHRTDTRIQVHVLLHTHTQTNTLTHGYTHMHTHAHAHGQALSVLGRKGVAPDKTPGSHRRRSAARPHHHWVRRLKLIRSISSTPIWRPSDPGPTHATLGKLAGCHIQWDSKYSQHTYAWEGSTTQHRITVITCGW